MAGSITRDNNTFVCSGVVSGLVTRQNVFVDYIEWTDPPLGQTSSLFIRSKKDSGTVANIRPTVSGLIYRHEYNNWSHGLYIENSPGGIVYIRTK